MTLRSARERAFQTCLFECGGLLLVTPAYILLSGRHAQESLLLIITLSVAMMVWSALYNAGFDWTEWQLRGRVASDRPHRMRLLHACLHEATSAIVTVPLIMWMGGMGFGAALALDLGLTLFYAIYAYVFHLCYDQLRPVKVVLLVRQKPAPL